MKMNTRVLAGTTTLADLVAVFDYTVKYSNLNAHAQSNTCFTKDGKKSKPCKRANEPICAENLKASVH
jgi:hypothetical protein